jgi:hypothetical protein
VSPLKSQVKIGTINELGLKYDDMRESAEKDIIRKEGYHVALNELQQSTLKSVFERIDADRDEGKLDLETAGRCKEYVLKVHAAIDNLRIMNEKHRLIAEGRVVGLREAITFAAKVLDAEKAKLQAAESQMSEAPEGGVAEVRPDAQMSAVQDLDQRRAAARAAKEAIMAPVAPVEEELTPSIVTSAAPLTGARRGRPPKAKGQGKEATA